MARSPTIEGPYEVHPDTHVLTARSRPDCALQRAGHEERVIARTGLRLDPYFSATKLAWILDRVPEAREAAKAGHPLLVVAAGEDLPVRTGSVGSVVIENLTAIEDDETALAYLADVATLLRPGGLLLALDAVKDLKTEERITGLMLAAGYTRLAQERPRGGALLTVGHPLPPAGLAARWASEAPKDLPSEDARLPAAPAAPTAE